MAVQDRLQTLLAQNVVTGIDFVYVHPNQTTLDVYFLRSPATLTVPLVGNLPATSVRIYSPSGGERLPEVPVNNVQWVVINGRDVMRATTASPGDFSRYRFHIEDKRIDPYFNDRFFSFKANCESDLDCAPAAHECPPEPLVDFPVDYTARDFWSFQRALLDFASQRYPTWQDRLEADVGVMLLEVMSALGDEFAYYQDRVGREAHLETASERRSLRRLARLVDYNIHDGLGASTWLDFEIAAGPRQKIPAGTVVVESGEVDPATGLPRAGARMQFEVGRGLSESYPPSLAKNYEVLGVRNEFLPHQWDEDDVCLPVGATEIYINGNHKIDLSFDDAPAGKASGKWVLLQTKPIDPAIAARAWMVRLIAIEDATDPVFAQPTTLLRWEPEQATPFELDLTVLKVRGNLVPATAGKTETRRFTIGPSADEADRPAAIEREGADGAVAYLSSLVGSDEKNLVWLGAAPEKAAPEIRLTEVTFAGNAWTSTPNGKWKWRRALLGTNSAQSGDAVFTLDDGMWRRVVGYQRIGKEIVFQDYASDLGKTVRFGDGEFGKAPTPTTIFEVTYRLDNGARGNVAAGTLTQCALPFVLSVTNPLPAHDGLDPETPQEVKQLAPEAFRALTFRAVRPEDYAEAAERLPWVQRAGAAFRWTGSWLTAYVTPDPRGAFFVSDAQAVELNDQIDRFRQAGRPAYMLNPRYASLDLQIHVCVEPFAYRGDVKERVLNALFGIGGVRPRSGFFAADNFTFGMPLERSQLEAVIQDVPGVRAVEGMRIRRRGWFDWRNFDDLTYRVADNEVVRVENDPLVPEGGSVKLEMEGGA